MANRARRILVRSVLVSALAATACATAPGCGASPAAAVATPPPPPPAAPGAGPIRVDLDVPLTFEAAGGRALPVPMVELELRGVQTRLIVDSGASHHVLTSAVATRARLQSGTSVGGRDHAGATLTAATLPDVAVRLGSLDVTLRALHSIDGPPPFEPLGIGGFLAPQRLFTTGYVVMDQPGRRLLRVETDDEVRALAWMRSRFGGGEVLETRYCPLGKPFTSFRVDAHPPVVGEIDTGGSDTELLAAAIGAGDTKGECAGIGVSGECVMSRPLEGVTVHFAGRSFGPKTVQVVAALDHGKGIDEGGLLGADVLRECVLAFPQSRRAGVIAHCPGAAASAPAPGPTAGATLPHAHGKRALLPRSPPSR